MELERLTSPARCALARAITETARHNPELRERLDADLAESGFESRSTDELIAMALGYDVPNALVDGICHSLSTELRPVVRTVLCSLCNDERVLGNDEDGWASCPNCNVVVDAVFDPLVHA